jgi:hypothetical protein
MPGQSLTDLCVVVAVLPRRLRQLTSQKNSLASSRVIGSVPTSSTTL